MTDTTGEKVSFVRLHWLLHQVLQAVQQVFLCSELCIYSLYEFLSYMFCKLEVSLNFFSSYLSLTFWQLQLRRLKNNRFVNKILSCSFYCSYVYLLKKVGLSRAELCYLATCLVFWRQKCLTWVVWGMQLILTNLNIFRIIRPRVHNH